MARKRIPRRQRLIEVGMDLFWDRSYDEVAIDDIAEAADISKGLLYYYFPTKHDFYAAVVQYAAEQLLQETEPDPALPPEERLRASLNAYFAYVRRHAKAYVALLRGGIGVDTQIASIMDMVRQTYVQRLLQHIPGGEALSPLQRLALDGWVGFVESLSVAWLEQSEVDQEELCDLAIAAFATVLRKNKRSLLSH